jgi:hypothetical protein
MTDVLGVLLSQSAVSLARYANIIGYSECAFFGIEDASNSDYACRKIWTKYERDTIADYLLTAQNMIEKVVGYTLSRSWFVAEEHIYSTPLLLDHAKLIAIGTKLVTDILLGATVSYVPTPATVTIPTALTSIEGIHIFYPGTDTEIMPSAMQITGGNLIISIPKCRLLAPAFWDNPEAGLDGTDPTIYQTTVDVKKWSTDDTDQGSIIYDSSSCDDDCDTTDVAICAFIIKSEIGAIRLGNLPGYCNTTPGLCTSGIPRRVKINYESGLTSLTREAEMAIIRLAHSLMPTEPCGCDVTQRLWKRDRTERDILSVERLNCPFGTSDGAWAAWSTVKSMIVHIMSDFSGRIHG